MLLVESITMTSDQAWQRKKQVAVIGASNASESEILQAKMVGSLLACAGATLLSGGMGGIMEASCQGVIQEGGIAIGIVPGCEGNPFLSAIIKTQMNHARNFILIGSCDAVIAIGGEYGTLTEIAYALKSQIPVYGLSTWDIPGVIACTGPEEAVRMAVIDT
jgi:TIGR00725 family protein